MLLQFGQRLLHRLVVDVAGQVDEEAVLPLGVVRGPRLDAVHADAVARERAEYVEQRAGLVVDEDQHRGAVVPRRREDAAADHQEARGVVLVVLDRAHDDLLQAIHMGGALAADGGGVVAAAGAACAFGIARYRHLLDLGQIGAQPACGLREGLRVRIDAFDVVDAAGARHKELVHAQLDFAADLQVGGEEHVQGDLDGALPRVLHRHHAEIGVAAGHFLEHLFDAGQRKTVRRTTEVLEHRLLAEGALRAEVTNLQRFLLRQAGGHDLAEDVHQHFVAERAFVAVHHHAQHLRLAFGTVIVHRGSQLALGLADLVGEARALGDQRLDLAVDAIDLGAYVGEGRSGRGFGLLAGCRLLGGFAGLGGHVSSFLGKLSVGAT